MRWHPTSEKSNFCELKMTEKFLLFVQNIKMIIEALGMFD